MQQRYATHPDDLPRLDTEELRGRFLVHDLFLPDQVSATYSHHDRVVMAGVLPIRGPVTLGSDPVLRSEHFLDRREAGVVNVGGPGTVRVDGVVFDLAHGECLYVGRGAADVVFVSADADAPAAFYLFSAPAHTAYPTTKAGAGTVRELGDPGTSNRRSLTQYIHEGGVPSCQLVMGVTQLQGGSMWNTMPPHVHERRTECYLYFDLPSDQRVVHLMGQPDRTRHLVVADRQAVVSPSWSLHAGFGTASYSFVWAMAGENKSFDDVDQIDVAALR